MAKKIPQRHQNQPRPLIKTKIQKGDMVKVIAGKGRHTGQTGRVLEVNRERGTLLVEGVKMVKRHTRPNPQRQIQGGIAERESPIAISNVMLMTSGGVATRVGFRIEGEGASAKRVRVA